MIFPDAPIASLRLGRNLDADNLRTGHDVYFECDVRANPPPLRLEWTHNVSLADSIVGNNLPGKVESREKCEHKNRALTVSPCGRSALRKRLVKSDS